MNVQPHEKRLNAATTSSIWVIWARRLGVANEKKAVITAPQIGVNYSILDITCIDSGGTRVSAFDGTSVDKVGLWFFGGCVRFRCMSEQRDPSNVIRLRAKM